jgi:hypothetical protein
VHFPFVLRPSKDERKDLDIAQSLFDRAQRAQDY